MPARILQWLAQVGKSRWDNSISMDIPYTQQFSVEQTPLGRLLPVLRQNAGSREGLKKAVAGAFFKEKKTPEKIAGNTLIALKAHGVIESNGALTAFGKMLINSTAEKATGEIAKNILKNLGGVQVVETLREMRSGGHEISLVTIADELHQRGLEVSKNSSDLSGVCGWLRAAGVLKDQWDVDDEKYAEVLGVGLSVIAGFKELNGTQIAFLRAMVALNVTDFTNYILVVKHAETLFPGEVSFNHKLLDKEILQPLEKVGLVEVKRAAKSVDGARGGKPAEVRPTAKFDKEVAEPLLASLFKNAGLKDLRTIRSTPFSDLVANVRQNTDINLKGQALEMLAIRICQLLGLEFLGWRETDVLMAAGGEVDGNLSSALKPSWSDCPDWH